MKNLKGRHRGPRDGRPRRPRRTVTTKTQRMFSGYDVEIVQVVIDLGTKLKPNRLEITRAKRLMREMILVRGLENGISLHPSNAGNEVYISCNYHEPVKGARHGRK